MSSVSPDNLEESTDGAKARIPVLKHRLGESEVMATTNAEKSKALAKSFFPTKPDDAGIPVDFAYPKACCKPDQITKEQIAHQIRKLKPYKAPGPDGIPNIVLMLVLTWSPIDYILSTRQWSSVTYITVPGKSQQL